MFSSGRARPTDRHNYSSNLGGRNALITANTFRPALSIAGGGPVNCLIFPMRPNLRGCSILRSSHRLEQNRQGIKGLQKVSKNFLEKRGALPPFGRLAQLRLERLLDMQEVTRSSRVPPIIRPTPLAHRVECRAFSVERSACSA